MPKKNKDGPRQLGLHPSPDALERLTSELESSFEYDSLTALAAAHLERSVEAGPMFATVAIVPGEATTTDNTKSTTALRRAKTEQEVIALERKNETERGKLASIEMIRVMVRRRITPTRQAIQQVAGAVDGLTPEQEKQLAKWIEDTLTNLSSEFDLNAHN